jgi:hypothetical protein
MVGILPFHVGNLQLKHVETMGFHQHLLLSYCLGFPVSIFPYSNPIIVPFLAIVLRIYNPKQIWCFTSRRLGG